MGDFLLFSHIQGDVINCLLYDQILFSLQAGEPASWCAEPEPQRLFAVSDRTFEGGTLRARSRPSLLGPGAHGAFGNAPRARKL